MIKRRPCYRPLPYILVERNGNDVPIELVPAGYVHLVHVAEYHVLRDHDPFCLVERIVGQVLWDAPWIVTTCLQPPLGAFLLVLAVFLK